MSLGSLFSGIGGLEMGLEMCGLGPVVWQCDVDPCSRAVLAKHWPAAKRYEDVRHIDGSATRVDVVCGGFPCQDISNAGKRVGIMGERSGLWFEFARVIRVLRPRYVFVENVAALANRGLDAVLGSLAALGFDAEWGVFSAAEAGAPHLRERLFLLAYSDGQRELQPEGRIASVGRWTGHGGQDVADADGVGERQLRRLRREDHSETERDLDPWAVEPDVGRVAHGVPSRAHRLRLLGNAVVPAQAALAYRTLAARVSL